MNTEITPRHIHATAFHEAAHGVMAVTKGCSVVELAVFNEPVGGALGHCRYEAASHWMDSVWISLAGPVADTITHGISTVDAFFGGGRSDFEKARAAFGKQLYPRVPEEFRDVIGEDVRTYLVLASDGWVPDGIRGQSKRRLTLFTNKCSKIDHQLCSWLYREADRVREFMINTPGFLEGVKHVAERLSDARHMTGKTMSDLLIKRHRQSH